PAAHELADYTYDYISSALASLTYVYNWFCNDYIKNLEYFAYDFFICFNQKDKDWAQKNLYEALLRFQNKNKKPIRIFFKREFLKFRGRIIILHWLPYYRKAEKIIWLCSENLFKDPENEFVLKKSFELDPMGDKKRIVQLQIDDNFPIPFEYQQNQILKNFRYKLVWYPY
ncbi:MAG: hypothetical protein HC906_12275, partial [Bacteroidales bacterium]|nr:hypothetical protein [Bacteroidales bacterium]